MKLSLRLVGLMSVVIFCGFLTNAFFPKLQSKLLEMVHKVKPSPTPTPQWKEEVLSLTTEESATMSSNFFKEFTTTPSPIAIPSPSTTLSPSVSDKELPTVTINGGPEETSTIRTGTVCFPLWVTDNVSSASSILSHHKVDNEPWTTWNPSLSPCVSPQPGMHTFYVQIIDEAGNISKEVKRSFRVE